MFKRGEVTGCARGKNGQVSIFFIVAIVIVVGVGIYFFAFRGNLNGESGSFGEVYNYYEGCISQESLDAISLAESQGGRVYVNEIEAGSDFAPFGSELNFLGFSVPYWYYLSGNGLIKEQVPKMNDIEMDIERYVKSELSNCRFDSFNEKGITVNVGEPRVNVKVQDSKVVVNVNADLVVSKDEERSKKSSFNVEVDSLLGSLYKQAKDIYDKEKSDSFLENYSVDVLRLYAPVDGVEIGCSPKVWKTREVVDELQKGLEANIGAIKMKGNYYSINDKDNYFVVDKQVEFPTRFLYSSQWPSKIEIAGAGQELMVAEPQGNRAGLGVLGFCYVPYHFVYDVSFPVMIQVYQGEEVFQFPVVSIIDKNLPRNALLSTIEPDFREFDLCESASEYIEVKLFDSQLNPVDGEVSYSCFDETCSLGESSGGVLDAKVPSCLNGQIIVRADGYAEKIQLLSTNEEKTAEVILDNEYDVKINLEVVGGKSGLAVVSFDGGEKSASAFLPDADIVKLSEGFYNVSVYVYGNSSVSIPASTSRQCHEVPKGGIFGIFGGSSEECFDLTIPETKIESALVGGGVSQLYIFKSDLEDGELGVRVQGLSEPESLEDLQYNYESFALQGVEVLY
ncbi:hypothetical protein COU54_00980 [Candidatus Pacearchaeota archaeon CG10_big_fil_rev_8_21_14_0_10_31_24]|nr:MAG: hypothetical protein COU54_00980 [Candidatus Pacearchaeota archaeon CG10_big_fil_rev_8_21_14_0_10_31_24]